MLAWFLNPAFIGLAALVLAIVWMLRDEKDKTRPWLVMALVMNLAYGWILSAVMGTADGLVPWKHDYVLFRLDAALGLPTTSLAAWLQPAIIPLFVVYQLMVPMMIAWFLVARSAREPGAIIFAYIAEMLAGPALYALLPACGPLYAFHGRWLAPPQVDATAIRMSGMPNAFPSLHLATALVFVLFAPKALSRTVAIAFLAATALATIATGEHYLVDLFAGAAFGCFAAAAGRRKVFASLLFGGLALTWSLLIRFASRFLLGHRHLLQAMAAATFVMTIAQVAREWQAMKTGPQTQDPETDSTSPETAPAFTA